METKATTGSGTFTPTLIDAGGGATYTLGYALGSYYTVGDLVYVLISLSSISTSGTPSGILQLGNLPFSVNISGIGSVYTFKGSDASAQELDRLSCAALTSTNHIQFKDISNTGTELSSMTFTVGAISLSVVYQK